MKPAYRDLAIGVTALVGVVGLVVILLLFGELRGLTEHTFQVEYRLNTAAGLVRGSKVTLNGVPIGQIVNMQPESFPKPGVVVDVKVNEGTKVPKHAMVAIEVGLLGEGTLALTSPEIREPSVEPEYLAPGEKVTATASTIFDQLSKLVEGRLEGLNRAAAAVTELSETYTNVGRRVKEMVAARTTEDVDKGGAEPNITTVIARLDASVAGAQKWLTDAEIRTNAKTSIAQFRSLLDQASETFSAIRDAAHTLESQGQKVGGQVEEAISSIQQATDKLSLAIDDTRVVLGKLIDGQGTAGQLLNNPDLYKSFNDAALRLEKALEEGQLLIEKWKSEGLGVHL